MPLNVEKFTFAELRAKQQADKHNSDLANLANAIEALDAHELELQRALEKLAANRLAVTELAARIEAGEVVPVDEVRKVYERAARGAPCL